MAPPSDLPRIWPAPLPLSPWPHLLFPLPKTHLPLPAVSHTPLLSLLVPVPLWPYGLAQPPGPSCHSWPCSPASLRAPLPTVPTDYLPFPSAPIVVPASHDSAPTPSGRLHAANVSLGVATTPFSPAAVCLAARVLLPPALPPANGAGQATAILLWFPPPTVAACAVNVTPPSAAPPYAAAFLASDAPPHGLLPAPALAPQSEPCSPPLLPVFLPRPHTVRPLAAVPLTSASRSRSPPPADAGLPLRVCPLPRFVRAFPVSASCVSLPPEPGLPAAVHRGQAVLPDGWGPSHATPSPAPLLPPLSLSLWCRRVSHRARALLPRLRLGRGVPRASARRRLAAGRGAPVPRRAPARRRPPALHRALAPRHAPARRRYPARRVFRLVTALRLLAVRLLVAVPLPVVVRRPVAKLPLSLLVLTLLPRQFGPRILLPKPTS
ncbi:unnamed protein product [Closterium sp. Naga37s-1]|nr:unnamed protein product [Closterium sp. Naga37s-1]